MLGDEGAQRGTMARESFSVATFNLFNLQEPGKPTHQGQTWSDEEFDVKIKWIAWQLGILDADIVGLQELWSKAAIEAVLEVHKPLKDQYDVLADPATGERIVCGALVRKGLLAGEPDWVDKFPKAVRLQLGKDPADPQAPEIKVAINGFSRPVLRFAVELCDDQPATEVFVTHLNSKLPTQMSSEEWFTKNPDLFKPHQKALGAGISTIRRTAEAVALRVLVTDALKGTGTPVVVLGDINDGQASNTANILTEQPRFLVGGSTGGSDVGLYTAQTLQEYRDTRDVYYTHVHQDRGSRSTMCWSASSSMTTADGVCGCSTDW